MVQEAKAAAVDTLHEAKDVATSTFREVKDSTMETVHEKVDDLRYGVRRVERETMGFLRENALPLALLGVGAAWLFARNRKQDGSRAYWDDRDDWPRRSVGDRGREVAHHAQQRMGEVKDRARDFTEHEIDGLRNAARDAGHRMGEAVDRAREVTGRELREARDYSRRVKDANPLGVGLAAMAAGVGVGLLLPATRQERELLGDKRQELIGEGKQMLGELTQTAREAVRDVKGSLSGGAQR